MDAGNMLAFMKTSYSQGIPSYNPIRPENCAPCITF
jgi:hypothetical protein